MPKRNISDEIHSEEWFRDISNDARLMYYTLSTFPSGNPSGVFQFNVKQLSILSGIKKDRILTVIDELIECEQVTVFEEASMIFFHPFFRENCNSTTMVKSATRYIDSLVFPEIKEMFYKIYSSNKKIVRNKPKTDVKKKGKFIIKKNGKPKGVVNV